LRCAAFFYPHLPSPSVYRTLSFNNCSSHSFNKHDSHLHAHSRTYQFRLSPFFDSTNHARALRKERDHEGHQHFEFIQHQGFTLAQIELYLFTRTRVRFGNLTTGRNLKRLAPNYRKPTTHDYEYSQSSSFLTFTSEHNLHADYYYSSLVHDLNLISSHEVLGQTPQGERTSLIESRQSLEHGNESSTITHIIRKEFETKEDSCGRSQTRTRPGHCPAGY
jgi:hypothetical protein